MVISNRLAAYVLTQSKIYLHVVSSLVLWKVFRATPSYNCILDTLEPISGSTETADAEVDRKIPVEPLTVDENTYPLA